MLAASGCGPAGVAAVRPAAAVLAEAAGTLRHTNSYHVVGMLDPGMDVDLVVVPGGSTGTVTTQGVTWREITTSGQTWFQGAALWAATQPAEVAFALSNNWVLVQSAATGFGVAPRFAHLDFAIPSVAFGKSKGLENRGEITLNGRRVVELRSETDVYDVLAVGIPYPVRWLELEHPGPNGKPCGVTLDRFGAPTVVTAPSNAVPGPI
jgi:hypothetical protein